MIDNAKEKLAEEAKKDAVGAAKLMGNEMMEHGVKKGFKKGKKKIKKIAE